ncbi:MAG: radical SAM protein [Acidobacteriota bacterium]|jgi:nitrogen fixation protein NifB|nr:radical SAM protein [Acidobacteriota bacterium]
MNDLSKHPCFNGDARHLYGRIHLPVAPRCNMQCNFCNRKFDCVNEGRPGVTSSVLSPEDALAYLKDVMRRRPEMTVVGFAGPGDPFANPEETLGTMRLVRREFPEILLCVATNGLGVGPYIDELAELKVSHVTLTVNAVSPEIGAKIYAWIRDGKRPLRGVAAASLLWERQRDAIVRLKERGVTVKINSILIPGVNDAHIAAVAETVADLGVDLFNCMAMASVEGAEFEDIPEPAPTLVTGVRDACAKFLPQMMHCSRCRADAAGFIADAPLKSFVELQQWVDRRDTASAGERPYVAVASWEGALVNQHLGEAEEFRIYQRHTEGSGEFGVRETRPAPPRGGGEARWTAMAELLGDCRAILVVSAGPQPQRILQSHGLKIVEMEGLIDEGLAAVYADRSVPEVMRRRFMGCSQGKGCRGTGVGCG